MQVHVCMCVHMDMAVGVSPHQVIMYKTVFMGKYVVWVCEGAEGGLESMCVCV